MLWAVLCKSRQLLTYLLLDVPHTHTCFMSGGGLRILRDRYPGTGTTTALSGSGLQRPALVVAWTTPWTYESLPVPVTTEPTLRWRGKGNVDQKGSQGPYLGGRESAGSCSSCRFNYPSTGKIRPTRLMPTGTDGFTGVSEHWILSQCSPRLVWRKSGPFGNQLP